MTEVLEEIKSLAQGMFKLAVVTAVLTFGACVVVAVAMGIGCSFFWILLQIMP